MDVDRTFHLNDNIAKPVRAANFDKGEFRE